MILKPEKDEGSAENVDTDSDKFHLKIRLFLVNITNKPQ